MKGFAISVLVLCAIASLVGLVMAILGNAMEEVRGATYLGSGVTGILLCCVVIVLADIREALKKS